jgi:hypothetical protein
MENEMVEELQLEQSFDKAFGRAEDLNAVFEKSEKPRQRIIVEILRRHNLPAFVGPFFDAYFRITAQGGDIEKLTILMITRLSAYLGEDAAIVAQRHKAAVADYIEFMSKDLSENSRFSSGEQPFMPADG